MHVTTGFNLGFLGQTFFSPHSEVKTLCGDHHLFPLSFLISVPCLSGQKFLRNPELSPGGSHMHHASHNYLANTEKKTHIMSCHIRHACYTSHSWKTPKVQNSSSKFKITRCRMGPNIQPVSSPVTICGDIHGQF